MGSRKKFNDIKDYHNGGGDMEQLRRGIESSPPITDEMLARVTNGISREEPKQSTKRFAKLISLDEYVPTKMDWLWPGLIPYGHITMAEGDPGIGKSTVLLADLVACVTTGRALPCGSPIETPHAVILISGEDGLGDTIIPRLIAAGADRSLVKSMDGIVDGDKKTPFSLVDGLDDLERSIIKTGARLVLIDPLNAYLGSRIDMNKDADVRSVLTPLRDVAERTGAAIVCMRHWGKARGGIATNRGLGSVGFGALARSIICFGRDPDDPTGERFILATSKSNVSKIRTSLSYRIVSATITEGGEEIETSKIEWLGKSHYSAEDLGREPQQQESPSAQSDAVDFLREFLANGEASAKDVYRAAKDAGISDRTLERAKSIIGVDSKRPGVKGGRVAWCLPDPDTRSVSIEEEGRSPSSELDRHVQSMAIYPDDGDLPESGPSDIDEPEPRDE